MIRRPQLDPASFEFLLQRLAPANDANLRQAAAGALGRAELNPEQLLHLAGGPLAHEDPLLIASLLEAFRKASSEGAGSALIAALLKSPVSIGEVAGKRLEQLLKNFSPSVQAGARPLFARLRQEQRGRIERLRKLEPLLTAGGDIGRGRRIFFGQKVACASCHTIGAEGGHVGPDLTAVGAIRSGHDLLEAIVFPSASFVPGFEAFNVELATEVRSGLIVERTRDAVVLVTGPHSEERIPRGQIRSIKSSSVSLMPDGLDESLTQAELTDLLAFLQSQKSRQDVLAMRTR
ncbi:MAG: c-type cytochrome [Acidobacteria bacterium]|nr:c-type cytochrome [Acidobacteriota bacterium]